MGERLLDFSISQDSLALTKTRNKHYQQIMCSIAGNSLTLLIFVIVQGYILRDHSDWDAILVLILACITIILEGFSLLQVFHMQTLKLIWTTTTIIFFEIMIIAISIYQTLTEAFERDTTLEIVVQITAIVIFFIVAILKLMLAVKLKNVFDKTKAQNLIQEGMKDRQAYENFAKTLK